MILYEMNISALVGIDTAKTARIQLHYVRFELLFMKNEEKNFMKK